MSNTTTTIDRLYGDDGIDERPWQMSAPYEFYYTDAELDEDDPEPPPAGGRRDDGESVQTRTAAGYVCTVRAVGGWEVVYSADDDAVREDLYDATVRILGDETAAAIYHAQLVERFASTDTEASDVPVVVEEMSDRVADDTGRRQVVPVLFAIAAAWTAFAAGQQVAHPVYRPTPEQAQAARAAWHREGAVIAAEDGFEGRVSAPAGTPRAARPFQGAL